MGQQQLQLSMEHGSPCQLIHHWSHSQAPGTTSTYLSLYTTLKKPSNMSSPGSLGSAFCISLNWGKAKSSALDLDCTLKWKDMMLIGIGTTFYSCGTCALHCTTPGLSRLLKLRGFCEWPPYGTSPGTEIRWFYARVLVMAYHDLHSFDSHFG